MDIENRNNNVRERVILIGIENDKGNLSAENSLLELEELAVTAGADTVGMIIQNRDYPHPSTYLGKGKIEELKLLIDENSADTVIADDELSPSQLRNLAQQLEIKVIDRTILILDIFASRAFSSEGKIQVELAQQKYRISHLTGLGTSLSRLGGGIGTRGPGEKKLEMDRRHIRKSISNLSDELKSIETHRANLRRGSKKKGIPTVSLVGYTNAGKSTLMNALTNSNFLAQDSLFATLDTTARKVKLPGGSFVNVSDTVGFINKLPHHLIKAFRATLDELKYSDILLHVVDCSSENFEDRMKIVYQALTDLGCIDKPIITVYNKIDLVNDFHPAANNMFKDYVKISAKNGVGFNELMVAVENILQGNRKLILAHIPYTDGASFSLIHQNSQILMEEHLESGIIIEAHTTQEAYEKLKSKDYIIK